MSKTYEFDTENWVKVADLDKAPDSLREDILYLILTSMSLILENEPRCSIWVDQETFVGWEPQNSEGFIYCLGYDRVLGFDAMASYYRAYSDLAAIVAVAKRFRRRYILEELADV